MADPVEPSQRPRSRPLWIDTLHVFALSGIAVAQPLFDIIQKNATFFIAHGTDPLGVVLFTVALIVVPPALAMAVLGLLRLLSRRLYRVLHTLVIGALAGLTVLPFATSAGVSSIISLVVFVVVAGLTAVAYERVVVVRRYGTVLAVAPVVLAIVFLFFTPVRGLLGSSSTPERRSTASGTGTPVVMLLMDEFSQGTILTPSGRIDEERFPNFARLAERSTWYPNATTNSNATHVAFPTIMTGRYPKTRSLPPVHSSYPHNLFSLLGPTYETSVDEWVTALCSVRDCRERAVVYSSKHLAADTALIYLHLVLPQRLKTALPPLGHQWAGFFADPAGNAQRLRQVPRSLHPVVRPVMDWLSDDRFTTLQLHRFDAFLQSIRREQRPRFSFLHAGLPHSPWHLLPDARVYDRQHTPGLDRTRLRWVNADFANAALQRYVMQAQGTDRLIGKLIDRLDEQRVWDDSLVVVMADHGITFAAGHTTRAVVGTEGDVLPIPLFVKYPDQKRGEIDKRNAETIDVLPTIADVIGIDPQWRFDGSSLAGPDPKRSTKRIWGAGRELRRPYDTDVTRSKTEISERIQALFGKASRGDDVFAFGPHRELFGRRIGDVQVDEPPPSVARIDEAARWARYDPEGGYVLARVSATIRGREVPRWVAVAVNGRIAGFGKPWRMGAGWLFDAMVSDRDVEPGRNELELYGIEDDGDVVAIRTGT